MTEWAAPSTPTGQVSRVPNLPGLDGLRAVAVVAVMVYHANRNWLHGGFLGVEVFFVISGYLITLLLIAEHERSEHIDLRQFWLRRFRRLLPALFVMLGLLMIYLAVDFRRAQGRTRGDIVAGVGYVSNWYQIWVGAGYTATEAFAPLRHLWSLAVEEQFYLLWPLIMVAILARGRARLPRMALWLLGFSCAIATLVAVLYVPGDIGAACSPNDMRGYWSVGGRCISVNDALYLSTITRAGGLMLGAAFAMVWRPMALMRGPMRTKQSLLDGVAAFGLIALGYLFVSLHLADPALTINGSRFDPWLFRGGMLVTGAATLLVIAAVTHQRTLTGALLGNPLFRWVGTRSYGLYLYHWPIYQIIRKEAGLTLSVWQFVVAMIVTVPLTEASYRFIEMPVRRGAIGDWLRRDRQRQGLSRSALVRQRQFAAVGVVFVALIGWAGVSITVAPNRCVGQVECTLADSAPDTTTAPTEPTEPPITTGAGDVTTPAPESTSAPTAAPTTTVPVELRAPIAVGESVMLGAKQQLQAGGLLVDAAENRQARDIVDAIAALRDNNQIGTSIVIQTGTNGVVSQQRLDEMMALLPAAEVSNVVFMTVKATGDWIEPNNALIRALPQQYTNVTVLDWQARAAEVEEDLSKGDGRVHLVTERAMQFYANIIFDSIGRPELDVAI